MNLFQKINLKLSSGKESDFKIECDALTDEDWECLAYLISKKVEFYSLLGVPTGGYKLHRSLMKYATSKTGNCLIVDDVLTTGSSMEKEKERVLKHFSSTTEKVVGFVVFARGKCPDWVTPLFQMLDG